MVPPDWSPLVYQISLCSLRGLRECGERYPLLSDRAPPLAATHDGGATLMLKSA